jgi:hypothetical protein
MIIFGLVTFAFFLFFMVLIPALTAKDILINLYMAIPTAIVCLQLIYDKYRASDEKNQELIRPIFWGKLDAFQNMRKSKKCTIIFIAMVLPLLLIKLLPA